MKLAFISDIHANLPALTAVLKDIDQQEPDDIYCLGDLVNFAGWDNEVIDLIRKLNITCIQGNHDEGIGYHHHDFPFSYSNESQKHFGHLSIERVNSTISDSHRKFLSDLPFMLRLEFRFPFNHLKLAMVHGSTMSNNEYVHKEAPDAYLLELMNNIQADVLLMGHTHIPYHKSIYCEEENRKVYRHAINVGSVGKPKHGNLDACYCLVQFDHTMDLSDPASLQVHFRYVSYDTAQVVAKIREKELPDAYDDYLAGTHQ